MNTLSKVTAIVLSCLILTSRAIASDGVVVSHYEALGKLSFEQRAAASQKVQPDAPVTLRFDALGRSFELLLEPNSSLLSVAAKGELSGSIGIYRGQLAGIPDSWARVVISNGMPSGLVWDGTELYAIERPGDAAVETTVPVIYRLADVYVMPGMLSCGANDAGGDGAAAYQKLIGELGAAVASAPGAVQEIKLGAVGDYEFTSNMGANADAAIVTRLNNVDGIFSQQLGVQITIATLETFADDTDPSYPFSGTLDAGTLLGELGQYRAATPSQNAQGLTHLYTGRDLDTSTVGIAYTSALCSTGFGAGLSEGNRGANYDSLIAAHEIGHNFGAPHDGEPGSPCESETGAYIMAPSVNGSDQFSSCSIAQMQDDIAAASCITPLPTVDMEVALSNPSTTVLLGSRTVLDYDVANNGMLNATNVSLDVTLPANLTLGSVSVSSGTCNSGAGVVNCTFGDVPGFGDRTLSIVTTPSTIGTDTLTAVVATDSTDERPMNNTETLQITVDPAVDLAIGAIATATVMVDASAGISTSIENHSVLDASGVTLSISLQNGLRADSASWSAGSCTVAAQQIDCQAAAMAAQSSSTLNATITGVTSGNRSFTVTLASNEAEAVPADNSVDGSIHVKAPKDESSGGAMSPLLLWLLLAMAAMTRRTAIRARSSV
jgi:uncharacterized repeat protein (TIGR01451 family)